MVAVSDATESSVQIAAQKFTDLFAKRFETVALARVFLVLSFGPLPASERKFIETKTGASAKDF